MIIRSVRYAGTVAKPGDPMPGALPQIAFSGRSNVGKSSLINSLVQRTRRGEARVSARPGKTQALNFFSVNEGFFLVDLPGYGYAQVPMEMRERWNRLVQWYLGESGQVLGVVQLIDARHEPTEKDRGMVQLLSEVGLPTMVVMTKIDKLRKRERERVRPRAREILCIDDDQVISYSSRTGEGREDLLDAIQGLLGEGGR